MEVLQFLLSGPGWFWRAFIVIWFLSVIFNGIANIIRAFLRRKSSIEELRDAITDCETELKNMLCEKTKPEKDYEDILNSDCESKGATKDDVRS